MTFKKSTDVGGRGKNSGQREKDLSTFEDLIYKRPVQLKCARESGRR